MFLIRMADHRLILQMRAPVPAGMALWHHLQAGTVLHQELLLVAEPDHEPRYMHEFH